MKAIETLALVPGMNIDVHNLYMTLFNIKTSNKSMLIEYFMITEKQNQINITTKKNLIKSLKETTLNWNYSIKIMAISTQFRVEISIKLEKVNEIKWK